MHHRKPFEGINSIVTYLQAANNVSEQIVYIEIVGIRRSIVGKFIRKPRTAQVRKRTNIKTRSLTFLQMFVRD